MTDDIEFVPDDELPADAKDGEPEPPDVGTDEVEDDPTVTDEPVEED